MQHSSTRFRIPAFPLVLLLALILGAHAGGATNQLLVMTYNLRFAGGDKGTNAWENRRPLMRELLDKTSPDLIGTQEGLFTQLQELAADLPQYQWTGVGRDGGNQGEHMAIFYKTSRLLPLSTNHFWLSDTPSFPSSTWGCSFRRMVTWVRFRDRQSGLEFFHFNTHFDHLVQTAREKSARLVRARVQELDSQLPVLLTGDFNAGASNPAHAILVSEGFFFDTWDTAGERRGEGLNSFNDFQPIAKGNTRIDWILGRGRMRVYTEEILTFSRDGRFPSDHFPVVAWLSLGD